jgi:hypothetical protein
MRKAGLTCLTLFLLLCIPWLWSYLAPFHFNVTGPENYYALANGSLYQRRHDVILVHFEFFTLQIPLTLLSFVFLWPRGPRPRAGFPIDPT